MTPFTIAVIVLCVFIVAMGAQFAIRLLRWLAAIEREFAKLNKELKPWN